MEPLKEFYVKLGLSTESADFAVAINAAKALEKGLELLVEAAKAVAEWFVHAIHQTAEYGEALEIASIKTGLATDSLQELGYVARLNNLSTEQFTLGLVHLSRAMDAAKQGGKEQQEAFARLGVRVTDANGKIRSSEEVLGDAAEGIKRMGKGAEATAISMKIFGRSGADLLPVLMQGKEGLAAMREEARNFAGIMSEEDIEQAGKFANGLKSIQELMAGLTHEFAGPFIEALNPVIDAFKVWVTANRELIKTKVQAFATLLAQGLGLLVDAAKGLGTALGFVIENWKFFAVIAGAALATLIPAFVAVAAAAIASGLSAAAAWIAAVWPLAAVAAALAIAFLIAEDFYGFLNGKESLTGDFVKRHETLREAIAGLKILWGDLKVIWAEAAPYVTVIAAAAWEMAKAFASINWEMLKAISSVVGKVVGTGTVIAGAQAKVGLDAVMDPLANSIHGAAEVARARGGLAGPGQGMFDMAMGGGASPDASVSAKKGTTVAPFAPQFTNHVQIHTQQGQSPKEIAGAVEEVNERWWNRKMGEAHGATGGS